MTGIHDVVVVGAGPGGSSTAYFLAKRGCDVLLVDKATFPREKTCGDGLSPRAVKMLDKMGLLQEVLTKGRIVRDIKFFSPSGKIAVEAKVPSHADLPNFALVLPRLVLDDLVKQRAVEAGARSIDGLDVRGIQRNKELMEITGQRGDHEERFRARLVVVATGANISLLRSTGVLRKSPPFMVAARAYYENVNGIDCPAEFHFDGVPLPGYGWIFPVSETRVNIGAGYLARRGRRNSKSLSLSDVFDSFVQLPHVRHTLDGAQPVGPVKGYPLRADFADASTFADGVLVVGEACGLVNPISGEGVDYALESGEMAAEFAADVIPAGDSSAHVLSEYDNRLRSRFQRQFSFTARMRDVYLRPWFLNRFLGLAGRRPEMNDMLVDIALGNRDAAHGTSVKTLAKILLNV